MSRKKKSFVTAVILAAGSGSRMGGEITKQRIQIGGESILRHTVRAFELAEEIDSIVIVSRADEIAWASEELNSDFPKVKTVISGGKNRAESAYLGFSAVDSHTDFVAIHDGARCLVTPEMINAVVRTAYQTSAASAACKITDTLKKVGEDGYVAHTLSRDGIYSAQTPQVFSYELYDRATRGIDLGEIMTDDNMLVERIGGRVYAVETGRENIKITTPDDIGYAEYILERRRAVGEIRIGHGYDVHRFVDGRKLILGGVEIPHSLGLLGHSDADVLTHAVMDALLGAAGLGDIGRHFPDTDGQYKDISSLTLLEKVAIILSNEGYSVENIDVTLVMQKPKVAPYIDSMIFNIANILHINPGRVNIKATTEEKLGFTGREEGVSCHAVALIKK